MPYGIPKTEYERTVTHGGTPPPRQYLNRQVVPLNRQVVPRSAIPQDDVLVAVGLIVGLGAAFFIAEYLWQRMQ